jgi:cell division protein FtsN
MGDDFDLFPKRENLDPFSFGTKEKAEETPDGATEDEVFGQETAGQPAITPPPQPELPPLGGEPSVDIPEAQPPQPQPPVPEPFSPPEPAPAPAAEPAVDVASPFEIESSGMEEPVEEFPVDEAADTGEGRKSPSPFILIGGALVVFIGVLYGVYTIFLKKDPPPPTPPPVAIQVKPQPVAPPPAPEPSPTEAPEPAAPEASPAEPAPEPVKEVPQIAIPEPQSAPPAVEPPEPPPPEPPPAMISETGNYSVQAGALILKSSVKELARKLESMGHTPIYKDGSTTAMMNMLSVGPFDTVAQATAARERIRAAGVDTTLRRKAGGGAVINAGSYLLEGNAKSITRKIRSLGYPVQMTKKEAELGMTIVRVGRFDSKDEAVRVKDELKTGGLDAIVVKLK